MGGQGGDRRGRDKGRLGRRPRPRRPPPPARPPRRRRRRGRRPRPRTERAPTTAAAARAAAPAPSAGARRNRARAVHHNQGRARPPARHQRVQINRDVVPGGPAGGGVGAQGWAEGARRACGCGCGGEQTQPLFWASAPSPSMAQDSSTVPAAAPVSSVHQGGKPPLRGAHDVCVCGRGSRARRSGTWRAPEGAPRAPRAHGRAPGDAAGGVVFLFAREVTPRFFEGGASCPLPLAILALRHARASASLPAHAPRGRPGHIGPLPPNRRHGRAPRPLPALGRA